MGESYPSKAQRLVTLEGKEKGHHTNLQPTQTDARSKRFKCERFSKGEIKSKTKGSVAPEPEWKKGRLGDCARSTFSD